MTTQEELITPIQTKRLIKTLGISSLRKSIGENKTEERAHSHFIREINSQCAVYIKRQRKILCLSLKINFSKVGFEREIKIKRRMS